MRLNLYRLLIVAAAFAATATSAAGARPGRTPGAGDVVSLRVMPPSVMMTGGKDAAQHFAVIAKYRDGIERDVTQEATLSVSGDHGQVDKNGRFTATQNGSGELVAHFAGLSARSTIQVQRDLQP